MKIKLYQVDAFASKVFEGNPAAVCPLESWLADDTLQSIAAENNLSETAFFVPTGDSYQIRWFAPTREVELCGHATLASAYVLFYVMNHQKDSVQFESKSGLLSVRCDGDRLSMDFPAQPPQSCEIPEVIKQAFDATPVEILKAEDYIVVYKTEQEVRHASPVIELLKQLDLRGVAITAKGVHHDFVCRFFAPKYGINEDPVTGSAFTQLIPYWSTVLGKSELNARQVSQRGGEVQCTMNGRRVTISGKAKLYLEGTIDI